MNRRAPAPSPWRWPLRVLPALLLSTLFASCTTSERVCAPGFADADGDGAGDPAAAVTVCDGDPGVLTAGDCDDRDAEVRPGAPEGCDGRDQDCDGEVDEGARSLFYPDADRDGFGHGAPTAACALPEGHAQVDGDCDDGDPAISPAAPETCAPSGPPADEDCDGAADEGLTAPYYIDADGDGFGQGEPVDACAPPQGYAAQDGDCDDGDPAVSPAADEACAPADEPAADEDCDGLVDEDAPPWYEDADGDGWGAGPPTFACDAPEGLVAALGDCDDADPAVSPSAAESCAVEGGPPADDDCDGRVDEGVTSPWYPDADGDGHGAPAPIAEACAPPEGHVAAPTDCDDGDAAVHPYAAEACDEVDQDCDGRTDEGVRRPTWYADADGDGYGDEAAALKVCLVPQGFVPLRGDCDDADPAVHPAAADAPGDCLDADCGAHPDAAALGADDPCGIIDDPQPCVGLPAARCQVRLGAALAEASGATTVWVGPGVYAEHDLRFEGKDVALRAAGGADLTTVDADLEGLAFSFDRGEGRGAQLDGFTITGGLGGWVAGAIYVDRAAPTLTGLLVTYNACSSSGGGLAVVEGDPLIQGSRFLANGCFFGNARGGGAFVQGGAATFIGVTFEANGVSNAIGEGGGLAAYGAALTLSQVVFRGNAGGLGGGLFLGPGTEAHVEHAAFEDNWVWERTPLFGGAIYMRQVSAATTVERAVMVGNRAGLGGGVALERSSPTFRQVVIVANQAGSSGGGGIYAADRSEPTLWDSILAWNVGYNLYDANVLDDAEPSVFHCALYYPGWADGGHNLGQLGATNLVGDPELLAWDAAARPAPVHLALTSPLVGAASGGGDVGLYGGEGGDQRDLDGDGLPDWPWPGERIADAPAGVDPADFDCDDAQPDPTVCP